MSILPHYGVWSYAFIALCYNYNVLYIVNIVLVSYLS